MISPIPAQSATRVEILAEGVYTLPEPTVTGIVCGGCSETERSFVSGSRVQVRHATVDHVRFCAARHADWDAESAAELAAERATERYFEERGAQDDPRERELWALEDARRDGYLAL